MTSYLSVRIIDVLANILVLLIIVDSILTYFMSPYHPLRAALDRIVQPLLNPIQKFIRPIAGLDFSPLILIVLIEIIAYLLGVLIYSL